MKSGGGWQVGLEYVGNQWWRFHGISHVYPLVVIIFSHPIPDLFPQGIFNLSRCDVNCECQRRKTESTCPKSTCPDSGIFGIAR